MARKHPRAYPADFRLKIIELARSGRGADELADEFKLARQTVRNWVKQADLDAGRRSDGVTTDDARRDRAIRKRIKQLEIERDILSKAAAWFARETDSIPVKVFEFVKAHHAIWPIVTQCRVLEVSTSGYYAWLKRQPSKRRQADIVLGDRIEALHRDSFENYGRPRIQADLRDENIFASDKRVARLMRERNIQGATRRKAFQDDHPR